MPQHIAELRLHRAGQVLAHEVAQVALPGHKTDQRNRPVGIGCFDQLDQLSAFAAHKADIGGMAGQPEHQLVEEQDHGVVTQRLRMPGHDAQAIVERNKRLAAPGQDSVR